MSEMQLWIHGRPNRQRNSDVRWALGRHWAIEPHWPWQRRLLARLPYEQQPTRGHLLCLVFDGHSTGGFVLFGAVTSAGIESERYSRPVARCADGACGPLRRGFGSSVPKEWQLMLRSLFVAIWRWRRWRLSRNQVSVESVASTTAN